ncbi:MAG: class I SAM-dependent methyltransferase [Parcubacteria group bacterium]|nr:class I SAM-dependent methyltransferase [Parcubacteria group bacterium]
MDKKAITIDEVKQYWGKKNIPQQWYSKRTPFTLPWFNELAYKRYKIYYEYIKNEMEFEYHRGEDVLEIGCGIGTDSVEYAKYGANVTATDLGPDQVMLTKLNFNLRNLPYKEVREANVEALPFKDGTFDLVVCLGVIHHTPDTQKAVNEMFRVLKPDGKAIVTVYARGWKHYIKRCFIHGILRGKWFRYGLDWQKVYNEVTEVHGGTPKTAIFTKREVQKLFHQFPTLEITKHRMGEFFDYRPYNTVKLPRWVNNLFALFDLGAMFGDQRLIKAQKAYFPKEASLFDVWFKHY